MMWYKMRESDICPKCGSEEFLVNLYVELKIDPNRNFGNVKYDWIDKVSCANMACNYQLDVSNPVDKMIIDRLVLVTKLLLASMKDETLIIR